MIFVFGQNLRKSIAHAPLLGTDFITASIGQESETVSIEWVVGLPGVTITSPADGSQITTGQTVVINGFFTTLPND